MATQAFTNVFRLGLLTGVHDLSSDVFKIALYTSDAELDETTTAYSSTNEVSGLNYIAGGEIISVTATYPKIVSNRAEVRFDDVEWSAATITAAKAMIYNTSKSNIAAIVLDFGGDQSSSIQIFKVITDDNLNAVITL